MKIKEIENTEFWLDIATPYGDPCDFIDTKPHKHPSATNIRVIRKSAYDELQARVQELGKALTNLLPAAIWYFEGPYGSSPDPESLKEARAALSEQGEKK